MATPTDKPDWTQRKGTHRAIFWGLIVLCAALGAADLVIHRHGEFSFEEVPFAYAAFGFVAFFFIVLTGHPLRRLLARDEDFYDR
jgi:hypothetical protein